MLNKPFLAIILVSLMSVFVSAPAVADDDDRSYQAFANKSVISRQQASNIAKNWVKSGRVVSIDYDIDDGVAVYEVDVLSGRTKYDVKVNAHTGKVIRVKRDNDD